MIKGETKEDFIGWDQILDLTDGGYDIFMFYLGKVRRSMKRPWGKNDRNPSWGVFPSQGVWKYKDMATEETGTAIQFVMNMFSLDFKDAIDKIKWDFGIGPGKQNLNPAKITWEAPNIERDYADIKFSHCPFDQKHAKYWNDYHLSEEYIRKFNIYRVKDLAINGRRINLSKDELTFAYYHEPSDGVKIMRIGVDPSKKWRNNVSGDTLWLKEYIQDCNKMIISKAVKDSLCLSLFGITTVAVQSEGISCIDSNQEWLQTLTCPIFVAFGTDDQGKEQSHKITKKYGYKHYNVPDNLLVQGINDIAEWCKHDIKALETHLKSKKLI